MGIKVSTESREPMKGKVKKKRSTGGRKKRRVQHPIQERSPNDQATGGYDPDHYPGKGPLTVGTAPIHSTNSSKAGIQTGIDLGHVKRRESL